ncbi:uncharacterized protein [Oryza sativa Japonica Group]|uniref:Uncharacterized protein n=1 Tax=Oryza rufipogon TaxID=4529 RepID=A0A0E0PLI3_ORYRU|nr:uncharacterized protein LOC4338565 [Oryza sativa Japonica Group]KAF2930441.1 hypothetical protein DAI22_05g135800 [Oryza sativa Japonica Group]KAF2930443.1 hypothetical protein DAI22_05g135800 [Oryza sativa Japonica Group]
MGRQVRKHEGSHGKVDAPPPKKPRSTERPLAPLAAATTTAKPRRDVVRPAARKSSASSDRGPVAPGSDLETEDSDGLGCLTPDSTKATLQQDDYGKGEYSPGVVLSKTDSVVKMAVADVQDLPVEDLRDNEVITVDSEGPGKPLQSIPLVQDKDAIQLARTFVNEKVKELMEGVSEPGVLQSRLSKITSFLVQATSIAAGLHDEVPLQIRGQTAALVTQISGLEQQVEELSKKLCSTEDELEVTNAMLKETQAAMLEAQSDRATAITAMNSLAMRMGASFARLGTILDPPPNAADSLEKSIKQMTALVSLLGPVSHSHSLSLARSSLTVGIAALLCRERGIEGLREPSGMDTRQFVRSQGPEFHSLISQVVDSMEQRLAKMVEGSGWRDSGATKEPGKPADSNKGTMPEPH